MRRLAAASRPLATSRFLDQKARRPLPTAATCVHSLSSPRASLVVRLVRFFFREIGSCEFVVHEEESLDIHL